MSGIRRVTVAVLGTGLVVGCGSSGPSGPNLSAPTISNLVVLTGADRAVLFRMSATDPQGDIAGGSCILRSLGFSGVPVLTVAVAVPANPTAPFTVTCTVTVPPGLTGRPFTGTIAVADAQGNASNQLSFTTTLPEGRRGAS